MRQGDVYGALLATLGGGFTGHATERRQREESERESALDKESAEDRAYARSQRRIGAQLEARRLGGRPVSELPDLASSPLPLGIGRALEAVRSRLGVAYPYADERYIFPDSAFSGKEDDGDEQTTMTALMQAYPNLITPEQARSIARGNLRVSDLIPDPDNLPSRGGTPRNPPRPPATPQWRSPSARRSALATKYIEAARGDVARARQMLRSSTDANEAASVGVNDADLEAAASIYTRRTGPAPVAIQPGGGAPRPNLRSTLPP